MIRKVLNELKSIGVVEIIKNCGAIVKAITYDDIQEIFEIRKCLEPLGLEFSFPLISLQKLSEMRDRFHQLTFDSLKSDIINLDYELHRCIIGSCNQLRLISILEKLFEFIIQVRFIAYNNKSNFEKAKQEHLALIDAIFSRNLEKAKEILKDHIETSKASTFMYLSNNSKKRQRQ